MLRIVSTSNSSLWKPFFDIRFLKTVAPFIVVTISSFVVFTWLMRLTVLLGHFISTHDLISPFVFGIITTGDS